MDEKRGWWFRIFGCWFDRDAWVRSQAAYRRDLEAAERAGRERAGQTARQTSAVRDELIRAGETIGRLERILHDERIEARERSRSLEEEVRRRRKVFREWKMCAFHLDPDGNIVDVEPRKPALVAHYLGADPEHVLGRRPTQIVPKERYFNLYAEFVVANAREFAMRGISFEPNTIQIGDEAFDVMAWPDADDAKTFRGSVIVIVPLRHKGWLERLKERSRLTIAVAAEVTADAALQYGLEMMRSGTRPIYLNFENTASVSRKALESLTRFYKIYRAQEAICVFQDVPAEVADALVGLGVERDHIKDVRHGGEHRYVTEPGT